MNNSCSELSFQITKSQKKLDKHSVSMYHIQQLTQTQLVELKSNHLVDLNSREHAISTLSKHNFRNTTGSFDLSVTNLNLNESQSNLEIILEAQQKYCDSNDKLPIDSALTTSASALGVFTSNRRAFTPTINSSLVACSLPINKSFIESDETYDNQFMTSLNSESALNYDDENNESILAEKKDISSIDTDHNKESTATSNESSAKNIKSHKKPKRPSAFAWVGRTVGKRINRNHFVYNNHRRRHQSPNKNYSILTTTPASSDLSTATGSTINRQTKKLAKLDWTENAKQGLHMWSDVNNTQSVDSCYLNEPDALEFHKIKPSFKCLSSSKGELKKKCLICKFVVHETCIDKLQNYVKCRSTYREAISRKKSFRDKEINSLEHTSNHHHWICRKYDENNFENKCKTCFKSYTNRFGMQTSRTIISCSWCKISYHLKCFSNKYLKLECSFGELSQLIVPPSWIVKTVNKNSLRINHLLRPNHRSSKRVRLHESSPNSNKINENSINNQLSTETPNLLSATNNTQISFRNQYKPFIIRPPLTDFSPNLSFAKPLLVLINPKSGGKLGPKLLKKFGWHLNVRQVFDLTQIGGPKFPLFLFRNVPNLRLLVGGGDGTVGWVLSIIDQINFLTSPPSVAILPLGTGNDLARALNWGSVYSSDEPLCKILTKVLEGRTVKLDRWQITTELNPEVDLNTLDNGENAIDKLNNDVMNNYFSLGADAHICLEFHLRREANPQKFNSRWFNLLHYVESGSKDLIKKSWKDLKDYIKLECDNKSYTELIRSRGYHFIIFLNISKYSGGTVPWGSSSNDSNFQAQSINDGKIEVIGCYTSTLAKLQLGGTGDRICQCSSIKLTTSTYIPIQIDGEPAKLAPSIIEIKHKNQAFMLEHVKHNTDSPNFSASKFKIQKNFQVKLILENDYSKLRNDCKLTDSDLLKNKALFVGDIYISNIDDNLSQIRATINDLIKESNNFNATSKWSFLNGDEFYRISEDSDSDAVLLDIVSEKETIYILDESPDSGTDENKSDFLFTTELNSTELAIGTKTKEDYDDYDLNDNYYGESENESNDHNIKNTESKTRLDKLRVSKSSPRIFSNQQLIQTHNMSSSKSTQFISKASIINSIN